jgi:hypothetical protein
MDTNILLQTDTTDYQLDQLVALHKMLSRAIGQTIASKDDELREKLIEKSKEVKQTITTLHPTVTKIVEQRIRYTIICPNCSTEYRSTQKMRKFCKKCTEESKDDLIEVIYSGGTKIYKLSEQKDAEKWLTGQTVNIRLDLHGVTDQYQQDDKITDEPICIISYVGRLTDTRVIARNDVTARVGYKQAVFGILLFGRGRKENMDTFHEVGSKAWCNKWINRSITPLFVDDSIDHCKSVKSSGQLITVKRHVGSLNELQLVIDKYCDSKKNDV